MAVSLEFEGKVIEMPALRSGVSRNGTNWAIQEYVIDVPDDRFPSKLCFEVSGEDKINKFDIHINDVVKVKANVSSTGWNGKFFTSVRAWAVDVVSKGTVAPPKAPQQTQQNQHTSQSATNTEEKKSEDIPTDELPF